jgi:hypothetical protein
MPQKWPPFASTECCRNSSLECESNPTQSPSKLSSTIWRIVTHGCAIGCVTKLVLYDRSFECTSMGRKFDPLQASRLRSAFGIR